MPHTLVTLGAICFFHAAKQTAVNAYSFVRSEFDEIETVM